VRDRTLSRDDRRRDRDGERPPAPPPADALLALQRGAGNRAVTGMLARDKDKAPEDTATSTTAQLGDIGVIPLDSASWDMPAKEVRIAFIGGRIGAKVMQASAEGKPLDPSWVSSPAAKSTLTGAIISSAQVDGDRIYAGVSFEKVDHEFVKR
jgi:hypothetical protein